MNGITTKTITAREGKLMNLISSIIIKNQPVREAIGTREKVSRQEDYGYQLYKTLEFGKSNQPDFQDHLNLDILSSRLK